MLIPTWLLPSPYDINIWGTREQLAKDLVSLCLQRGLTKSLPLLAEEDHTNQLLHAMRVAYFVVNPSNDPIEVEMRVTDKNENYVGCLDGQHRLAANIYLTQENILAIFNPEVEVFVKEWCGNIN